MTSRIKVGDVVKISKDAMFPYSIHAGEYGIVESISTMNSGFLPMFGLYARVFIPSKNIYTLPYLKDLIKSRKKLEIESKLEDNLWE